MKFANTNRKVKIEYTCITRLTNTYRPKDREPPYRATQFCVVCVTR